MMPGMGRNPKQMKQMMKKMGISTEELDATEVIIRTRTKELHIKNPAVTIMTVQGEATYQIVGNAVVRPIGEVSEEISTGPSIPDEDVSLVAMQAGVSDDEARKALEDSDGDLAEAIVKLQEARGN